MGHARDDGLRLPEYEQVVFHDAPLEEVVCQLRFHEILKIAAAPPVDFQEYIRKRYPVLSEERGVQFAVTGNQPVVAPNEPAWKFKTNTEDWAVTLTKEFVALRTTAYTDFEDFLEHLFPVVDAFEKVYEPPFYVRLGLRYVNRFIRQRPVKGAVCWEELLNSHLSGAYVDPVLSGGIAEAKHHLVLQRDRGQIGWRYSRDIGQADGKPGERFTLDFDHYVIGEVPCRDVREMLVEFNDSIYRLFRWCLTEKGYKELKPRPKKGGKT